MRTGTVASVDNRNWEIGDHVAVIRRLSQSRAIALDMESAAIAANGFRFRVPYGTLLCVSDKPLHGEIKLPGAANAVRYRTADAAAPRYLCAYEVERTDLPMSKLWNDTSDIGRWKPEVRPYTYNKRYIVGERIFSA